MGDVKLYISHLLQLPISCLTGLLKVASSIPSPYRCIHFLCCCNQAPPISWFNPTGIYYLTVLYIQSSTRASLGYMGSWQSSEALGENPLPCLVQLPDATYSPWLMLMVPSFIFKVTLLSVSFHLSSSTCKNLCDDIRLIW